MNESYINRMHLYAEELAKKRDDLAKLEKAAVAATKQAVEDLQRICPHLKTKDVCLQTGDASLGDREIWTKECKLCGYHEEYFK